VDPRTNDVLNENKFGISSRNVDVCLRYFQKVPLLANIKLHTILVDVFSCRLRQLSKLAFGR
jgi:hypothetical protein